MKTNHYDIAVIGGGIHGVGVAQAATARGYSTILLEQNQLASGTSSRSSKLIHGGLRYLETGQFPLVYECLHERKVLLRLAPDLVQLKPFIIPVFNSTCRRPWEIRTGLSLYALVGGFHSSNIFQSLPKKIWHTLDGLKTHNLQAVFKFWDAQTDDVALTHAVMESALTLGAELSMPAKLLSAELNEKGCVIHYQKNNERFECETTVLINATGPWVNTVISSISPSIEKVNIDLVQGCHILVKGQLTQGIYYTEAPEDQRVVFVMPWQNKTLVGTTETRYQGDPRSVIPLAKEEHYLLETLAHYFPAYDPINRECIVSSFAGLRVLPVDSKNIFRRSRETILHTDRRDKPRVLSIYGGKLTAYRAVAEKIMQRLNGTLPDRTPIADTEKLKLTPV